MAEVRISAEQRTEFGKGGARRTRRAGLVPAVIYGHGQPPRHISLPAREIGLALRSDANVLLRLDLEGGSELALAKDVQRDPLKQTIDHIDLIVVRRGEKVRIDVPIQLIGEVALVRRPAEPRPDEHHRSRLTPPPCRAASRSTSPAVEVGTTIFVRDVKLPDDVTVITDGDALVVSGLAAPTAEQLDAELAEAEAEVGAGEVSGAEPSEAAGGGEGEGAPAESAESAEQPAEA